MRDALRPPRSPRTPALLARGAERRPPPTHTHHTPPTPDGRRAEDLSPPGLRSSALLPVGRGRCGVSVGSISAPGRMAGPAPQGPSVGSIGGHGWAANVVRIIDKDQSLRTGGVVEAHGPFRMNLGTRPDRTGQAMAWPASGRGTALWVRPTAGAGQTGSRARRLLVIFLTKSAEI